ncbi:MAG TPA: amidohydrolase family protein [Chryseosolibacter sp.]|nr:amidohydrolase family protein [Chryseosolibacter sp.]
MKNNRRNFLKAAGITAAGAALIPGCNANTAADAVKTAGTGDKPTENWKSNPEWRQIKYGAWSGPGVPDGPGPMDSVLLKDYAPRSSVVGQKTFLPKAKFPVIDVHVHNYPGRAEGKDPVKALTEWVQTQRDAGITTSVVLTSATGNEFDELVKLYLDNFPDQFQLYCGLEKNGIDEPDYPERAVAELERCYKKGARGVGELSDKGFGLTRDKDLAADKRLHADDARLDPFWRKCAVLKLPVNIHIADHPSSWEAPDVFQERTPVFQQFNKHDDNGLSFEALLDMLPRLLQKHPETTFIACHLANLGHDLSSLEKTLDRFPNLYLDISARDYEVGRQPRRASKFLDKYKDRVLFGTDMGMDRGMYQNWWRLLESDDEYMEGRVWWRYYALDLPDAVLEPLYHTNARRVMNWTKV